MLPSRHTDSRDHAVVRTERELARLETLAARRRYRIALLRSLRGAAGAGGTLLATLKLKIAGSLGLKLLLAGLVGLGLAWPAYALAAVVIGFVLLSVLSCEAPDCTCDAPGGCRRKERRRKHLDEMIAARREWLRDRSQGTSFHDTSSQDASSQDTTKRSAAAN